MSALGRISERGSGARLNSEQYRGFIAAMKKAKAIDAVRPAMAKAVSLMRRNARLLEQSYTTPSGQWPEGHDNHAAHCEFDDLTQTADALEKFIKESA